MKEDPPNILLLWIPLRRHVSAEEHFYLRRLIEDLRSQGTRLVPFPPFPPWFRPFPPREIYWQEWEYWLRRWEHDWVDKWELLYPEEQSWPEQDWMQIYSPEVFRRITRLFHEGVIDGMLIVTLSGVENHEDAASLEETAKAFDVVPILHLTLGQSNLQARPAFEGALPLNYPSDRSQVLERVTSMSRDTLSIRVFPTDPSARQPPPPAAPPDFQSQPQASPIAQEPHMPDEVHLGVGAPPVVSPGEEFVARFAAYADAFRTEVERVFEQEAPSAHPRLDLETCRWHPGTRVTVRLDANHVEVSNPVQTFTWNGSWHVLRFDALVHEAEVKTLILKFDIAVEGLPIIALRPEIELLKRGRDREATAHFSFIQVTAPNSAFASYARRDRREVLSRVRSLQIFTSIDVFLDCLSIRPGEEWKETLQNEICGRDIFWLFWSRNASDSEWVEWEWRAALASKSLNGIQPHPLEPAELAPPPKELSSLQFGNMYEWYISELREPWLSRRFRMLWHEVKSSFRD